MTKPTRRQQGEKNGVADADARLERIENSIALLTRAVANNGPDAATPASAPAAATTRLSRRPRNLGATCMQGCCAASRWCFMMSIAALCVLCVYMLLGGGASLISSTAAQAAKYRTAAATLAAEHYQAAGGDMGGDR